MTNWELTISNIGGIHTGHVSLRRGTNVVRASNWHGKSSLLNAIQAVMGTTGLHGERHPLTEGKETGEVLLDTGGTQYQTRLERSGRTIQQSGETYLGSLGGDPPEDVKIVCARNFAFLGEHNPVREAVRTDGNLVEVLTQPLDVDDIDERIEELEREGDRLERTLESARQAARESAELESEISHLESTLEELRTEYESASSDQPGDDGSREELSDLRAKRDRLGDQIQRLEDQYDRIESRLEQNRRRLEQLEIPAEPTPETDADTKRARVDELERKIELLESVWRANQRVFDEGELELLANVEHGVLDDTVDCWVCGRSGSSEEFESHLESLADRVESLRAERTDLADSIATMERRRDEIRSKRREKRDLETEISELETRLESTEADIAEARMERSTVESDVKALESVVESTDDRLAELSGEIKVTESKLEDARDRLDSVEEEASKQAEYRAKYTEVTDALEELRGRKYRKKRELAEAFERTMQDVIEIFNPGFETARLDVKTDDGEIVDYDIVVARGGRESPLSTLSEGELELLGFVAAIAGFETFDVDEFVPVILLDGIGALASEHIHTLVEYLDGKTDFLVTTAYPEIESFDSHVVTPGEWSLVTEEESPVT
ncbi:MAG: archaea-specific SMC-related protein [Natronomonas sp.]